MPAVTKLSTLLHAAALTASACALLAAPPTMAQGALLYDIDFGAPTHTLNAKPAVGAAPNKISRINFGSPNVVSGFGALTDRPLLFTGGSESYDQIELNGNYEIETCRLEFDVVTEALKDSGMSFTVLFDTPNVRRFSFDGASNRIEGTAATWEEGRVLHCIVFADFKNNRWEASINGDPIFSTTINAEELRSIRFSVGKLGGPRRPEMKVAVDNILVTVTNRFVPAVPAGFSATGGVGAAEISLSWNGVPEAQSYRIFRDSYSNPNPFAAVQIAETSERFFTDKNVLRGQEYYYWVKSVAGGVASQFGQSASARIDLAPPASLSVSGPERFDGIRLSWPAAAFATSYNVYRSYSNTLSNATFLTSTSALTYLDTGTITGVRSYYWVDSRAGGISSPSKVTGNGIRGLGPVSGLKASSHLDSNRIELRWNEVPGATRYAVYRGESDDFMKASLLGLALTTSYQDLSAENDRTYRYWVRPLASQVEGPTGSPVNGVASLFQPDLWLEAASEKEFGRGIVQGSENPSILTERGRNRSPITAKLWVGKIGVRDGWVTVEGSPGNADFGVNYYREGNVTAEVLASRLQIDSEDGKGPVQILIQPSRRIQNLPGERVYTLVCRGVSVDFTTAEDQVQMDALSLPMRLRKPVRKPARKPQVPAWTRPSIEDRAN